MAQDTNVHTHQSTALGGMDKDTDLLQSGLDQNSILDPNDYIDANDMSAVSTTGQSSAAHNVVDGSLYADRIGTVGTSYQSVEITFTETGAPDDVWVVLMDANHTPIFSATDPAVTISLAAVATWLDTELSGYDATISASDTGSEVTVTWSDDAPQWYLTFAFGTETAYQTVNQITENIPTSLTGRMTPIGWRQIGDDLLMFSANKSEGGVGEIGVLVKDGDTYDYTRLLRSVEFTAGWFNLADMRGERNGTVLSAYWTDGSNKDRSFIYNGDYSQDGALAINSAVNNYYLGSINLQTKQQSYTPDITLSFSSQTQTTGNLLSGNKRYAARLLTEQGNYTNVTPLTGIIPVYTFDANTTTGAPSGNPDGTVTAKINVLSLSAVDVNVWPRVQLICAEYHDTTVTIYGVGIFDTGAASTTLQHTGFEDREILDTVTISLIQREILHSLNTELLDSRHIKSNLTYREVEDLRAFFLSYTLTTKVYEIPSEGVSIDPTTGSGGVNGGYLPPEVCFENLGYMDNETYRFMGRAWFTDGSCTPCYLIADKTIDIVADDPAGTWVTNNGASLTEEYGVGATPVNIGVRYVEASNPDWSLINTLPGFAYVEIGRADCIPEVLSCGLTIKTPYAYLSGGLGGDYVYAPFGTYVAFQNGIQTFISPDLIMGGDDIVKVSGDQIKAVDLSLEVAVIGTYTGGGSASNSDIYEYSGWNGIGSNYITLDIKDYGSLTNTVSGPNSAVAALFALPNDYLTFYGGYSGTGNAIILRNQLVLLAGNHYFNTLTNGMAAFSIVGLAPVGNTYAQYFRQRTNKYGGEADVPCTVVLGKMYDGDTTLDLFGGDTFIEKFSICSSTLNTTYIATGTMTNTGLTFFSQNRLHTQLRSGDGGGYVYPGDVPTSEPTWNENISKYLTNGTGDELTYSESYTPRQQDQAYAAYNPLTVPNATAESRIIWSAVKPIGSLVDYYLDFRELDTYDLPTTWGGIYVMLAANGQLWTGQEDKLMQQYFNSNAMLQAADASYVNVSSGAVMGRRGIDISKYGTSLKWGWTIGRSDGGGDTLAGFSDRTGRFVRIGADGTVVLSDRVKMRDWSRRNTTILKNGYNQENTPTSPEGQNDWGSPIYAVWYDRLREFRWTARARKYNRDWASDYPYDRGTTVLYPNISAGTALNGQLGFGNFAGIYRALVQDPDFVLTPPSNLTQWELVPLTDETVFNYWTLAFSEYKNRFTSFYTPKPRIYMPFNDTFVTSGETTLNNGGSTLDVDMLFVEGEGDPLVWNVGTQSTNITAGTVFTAGSNSVTGTGFLTKLPNWPNIGYLLEVFQLGVVGEVGTTYYVQDLVSDTVITLDRAAESSLSAGVYRYLCQNGDAYRTDYCNVKPLAEKRYTAQDFDCDNEPNYVSQETSTGQESYLERVNPDNSNATDIQDRLDGTFFAPIHNDTSGGSNNLVAEDPLKGRWLKTTVHFRPFQANTYRSLWTRIRMIMDKRLSQM